MNASGSTLVVSELISQLPWGADNDTITVTHPDGEYSHVIRVETGPGSVTLEIDADPDSVLYRTLLDKTLELLDGLELAGMSVKDRKICQQRIIDLAEEIEAAP